MICRYCHKESLGVICGDCKRELDTILFTNDECCKLNEHYANCGIFAAICVISFIVMIFMKRNDVIPVNIVNMLLITFGGFSYFFTRLRKMISKQIDTVADREMRKNHQ